MNIYKLTDFGDQEIIIGSRADYSRKSHMRLVKKDWLDFVKGYDNSKIFQKDYGFDEKAFLEKYGLRAVQFGNWMDYSDRADHFIALVESLNHLEKIMGTSNIGWYGRLSIAIGARGRSGALAHFEPRMNVINLTKEKGGHSFAHEYGHAIDYIGGEIYSKNPTIYSISNGHMTSTQPSNASTDEVRNLMCIVLDGVRTGARYPELEKFAMERRKYDYWCNNTEIWARTFAQWVALECRKIGYDDTLLSAAVDNGTVTNIPEKELVKLSPYISKLVKLCASFLNTGAKVPPATTKNPYAAKAADLFKTPKRKVAATKKTNKVK